MPLTTEQASEPLATEQAPQPLATEQTQKQDTAVEANTAAEQKDEELNLEDLDLELKELEEAVAPLALHAGLR